MKQPWYAMPPGPEREAAKESQERAATANAAKASAAKAKDAAAEWVKIGREDDGLIVWRKRRLRAISGASQIRHLFRDEPTRRLAIMLAHTHRLELRGVYPELPEHDWQYLILRRGDRRACCLSPRSHSLELALRELFETEPK